MAKSGARSILAAVFPKLNEVGGGALANCLYDMCKQLAAGGTVAAAAASVSTTAVPIAALIGVAGLLRIPSMLKSKQREEQLDALAEAVKAAKARTDKSEDLLRSIVDGSIELNVNFDELVKDDLANAVAGKVLEGISERTLNETEAAFEGLTAEQQVELLEHAYNTLVIVQTNNEILQTHTELLQDILSDLQSRKAGAISNTNFSEAAVTPNRQFVGRRRELAELERKLAEGSVAVHHAVTADGGFGKSALAFEFAFRQRDAFDGLWFVDASDPTTIDLHCRQILRAFGQGDPPTEVPTDQLAGAVAALLSRARHLLLLDDVRDPQWIRAFAVMDPARVLVTTRLTDLPGDLVVKPMPLDVLDRPDSIALLRQGREDLAEDDPDLGAIADHLGDHALALTLTAALLQRRPRPKPGDVLDRLRRAEIGDETHLLEGVDPASKAAGYRRGVAESLTLLLPELDGENDDASRVARLTLACLSLLAPRDIPTELVRNVVAAAGGVDADAVDEALARLAGLSVIRFENDDQTLAIHGLTQQVLRHRLGGEDESNPLNVAKRTLCRAFIAMFPEDQHQFHTVRELMTAMLPHILACVDHLFSDEETNALLNRVQYLALHVLGDCSLARRAATSAEQVSRTAYGDDHPNVATDVNNLGGVLEAEGDLAGARAKYEEAERIWRVAYGDDHPNVATAVNNLGAVLRAQGDLAGARAKFEEAERIDRAAYGDDHPNVAIRVNNLGEVLRAQGDLAGARARYEEAERIDRAAYGDDHPNVAIRVNNIGMVLYAEGDLAGARAKYEEAERIDRAAYGDDHPDVATDVNNLGGVLEAEGDLAGARVKYEEAFRILVRAHGPRGQNVVVGAFNVLGAGGDPLAIAREVGGAEVEAELKAAMVEAAGGGGG